MNYWHCNPLLELRKADSVVSRRELPFLMSSPTVFMLPTSFQTTAYRGVDVDFPDPIRPCLAPLPLGVNSASPS